MSFQLGQHASESFNLSLNLQYHGKDYPMMFDTHTYTTHTQKYQPVSGHFPQVLNELSMTIM